MEEETKTKRYDLEERTEAFARRTAGFIEKPPKTLPTFEYEKQLIRSSGSVGANYLEANEALSRKDFLMRIKIRRKEVKGSRYWLRLVRCTETVEQERQSLIQEATELIGDCSGVRVLLVGFGYVCRVNSTTSIGCVFA